MATNTTITDYPDWMKTYLEDVLEKGKDLYDTDEYTPYGQPRIAPFTAVSYTHLTLPTTPYV